ncbi:LysR family transcriptional regulator [Microbacterium gilvum]|uniref:LysR family transcriptional regulator n=1 Tax=Microbacterium gilvum TaxID=1336204 RepID=A0ABP9ATR1_9MICO
MDMRHLAYAVAVADERSFTRAARRVFAVQSSVSAGVAALERELGAVLFDRDARGVRLTMAGEAVLPELRAALDAVDRARIAADPEGGLRGRVRVGVFSNLGWLDLPALVGAFHERHPLVEVEVRPSPTGSTGLAEDVLRGRLDIALFGLPATSVSGLIVRRLTTSPFAAVLPEGHPLADRPAVALAELAAERFVDTPAGFGNRSTLDAAFATRGLARVVSVEVADIGSLPDYVAAGLGIAVLPEISFAPRTGTAVLPLSDGVVWELNAVTRQQPSPATVAFADLLPSSGATPGDLT